MKYSLINNIPNVTIKESLKHKFSKKYMCFCDGPVSYYGYQLTAHYKNSNKMKAILNYIDSSFDEFWNYMEQPNVLGFFEYCGHGNQYGNHESFHISDYEFTRLCSSIHPDSQLVILMDCCFSDGMLDSHLPNVAMISSARISGPNSYALYTGDGGYMSWCFTQILSRSPKQLKDILLDMMTMYHSSVSYDESPQIKGNDAIFFP